MRVYDIAVVRLTTTAFAPAYMEYVAGKKLEKYPGDDLLVKRVVPELLDRGAEICIEFIRKVIWKREYSRKII